VATHCLSNQRMLIFKHFTESSAHSIRSSSYRGRSQR